MNFDFNFKEAKGFKRILVNAYYVPDTILGTLIHLSHDHERMEIGFYHCVL